MECIPWSIIHGNVISAAYWKFVHLIRYFVICNRQIYILHVGFVSVVHFEGCMVDINDV